MRWLFPLGSIALIWNARICHSDRKRGNQKSDEQIEAKATQSEKIEKPKVRLSVCLSKARHFDGNVHFDLLCSCSHNESRLTLIIWKFLCFLCKYNLLRFWQWSDEFINERSMHFSFAVKKVYYWKRGKNFLFDADDQKNQPSPSPPFFLSLWISYCSRIQVKRGRNESIKEKGRFIPVKIWWHSFHSIQQWMRSSNFTSG